MANPPDVEARIKAAEKATNDLAVPVPDQLPAVWGLGKPGDTVKGRLQRSGGLRAKRTLSILPFQMLGWVS